MQNYGSNFLGKDGGKLVSRECCQRWHSLHLPLMNYNRTCFRQIEQVLGELNIPTSKILVNVGDDKITSNDDLREFKNLDTPSSNKQFILLVNKGKEGWNCRSLFSVALHREPKSKVFVLQATMRCLRQIGDYQHTAGFSFR